MSKPRFACAPRPDRPAVFAVSLLAACAAAVTPVLAQESAALVSEAEYFDEVPVVLSVTRLAQPRSEAPAAITVIDRAMIEASGVRQLPDIFRLVPGYQVAYPSGHQASVTYHGVSDQYSRRMQVLVDGRSVYGPLFGGVSWSDLPLAIEDIERIEVIRGPNAAAYGSNAFWGIINIVTHHASQDAGSFAKVTAGNHDIGDFVARQGVSGAAHDTRLTIGSRGDDGLDGRPDNHRSTYATLRSDWRGGARDAFELQAGVSGGSRDQGFYDDPTQPPHDSEVRATFAQLRWQRTFDPGETLSVQFYHTYGRNEEQYLTDPLPLPPPFGPTQVPVDFTTREERYDLEAQHTFSAHQDVRVAWGAAARLDRVRSMTWFNTDETLENRTYRLFANGEWHMTSAAVLNAGVMWEDTQLTGSDVSPRLALNYHLQPNHTLRAVASRATRVPVIAEDNGDQRFYYQGLLLEHQYLGPGDLRVEKLTTYELGYLGEAPAAHVSWDVRVYQDHVTDLLTEIIRPAADLFDQQVFSLINQGRIRVRGAEAQVSYRPRRDTMVAASYAAMTATTSDFPDPTVPVTYDAQEVEESVPSYSASLFVMQRLTAEWRASLWYSQVANMRWLGNGDPVPRYGRLDLRLAHPFRVDGARGEVALVVQNAGRDYTDFRDENVFDRRCFLTLALGM
jgi:iron complex outermembrane receptor protein